MIPSQELQLRPVRAEDEDFLRRLYAEVRAPEIALTGWDAASAEPFLRMQFNARRQHYRNAYPEARLDIVERAGVALGNLSVARMGDQIRVIDIALLAQYRNGGLGGALLRSLQDEAACAGSRLTLQVEQHNPALTLYRRLGFTETDHQGLYHTLAWRSPFATAAAQG